MGLMTDPCHPGEILRHEFFELLGVSAIGLAKAIGVPRTRIERLVKRQTGVTPDTALRLSNALWTTPEFWIIMQANYDMAAARKSVDASGIKPLVAA
ncbi:HigA family addiction module antitoxin [Fluviibacterium sp. DFM31]|uniref:HigA family addiction module antitoxin n=1 Tax=Meridianimarinicoccus marinus TaxID=3231483 RepID=A0ABV3LBY2_9RHOB